MHARGILLDPLLTQHDSQGVPNNKNPRPRAYKQRLRRVLSQPTKLPHRSCTSPKWSKHMERQDLKYKF